MDKKWKQEFDAVYDAQGIILRLIVDEEDFRVMNMMKRIRYRLDQRMEEISPATSPTPVGRFLELNAAYEKYIQKP